MFTAKRVAKGKDRSDKNDKPQPTDDKLREAICDILKEVDFNTVTVSMSPYISHCIC